MKKAISLILIVSIFFTNVSSVIYAYQLDARPPSVSPSEVLERFREIFANSARTYFRVPEAAHVALLPPPVVLVNRDNPLERYFRPENMIDISGYVRSQRTPMLLEENAANAFIKMIASMHEYGITNIAAISGFRDWDRQNILHNNQVHFWTRHLPIEEARERAATVVAPPGASEHQTGLAIDVSSACIGFALSERFEQTEGFRWLSENAHTYGFIIRYPRGSTEITGVIFEPWHLRYVGTDHATRIFEAGVTLEEYLNMYMLGAWSE